MASPRISPDHLLPTRMTLSMPANLPYRFSVLEFPYAKALAAFMERFQSVYQQQKGKALPYKLRPPFRQLNDALLALAPSLIQGFENVSDDDDKQQRMIAFTRLKDGGAEDFPTQDQLRSLIRHWIERWGEIDDVRDLIYGHSEAAWQALMSAIDGDPETEWKHDIDPARLAANLSEEKGLAWVAIPALLTALLHEREITIRNEKGEQLIRWRRAHDGGNKGLHLVSQPIPYDREYFAYRLDFSLQTQAGFNDGTKPRVWVFAHLGIQRYITERYRGGDKGRAISVLVGCNREHFVGGWEKDTTLIRLGVEKRHEWQWEAGVGRLLDDFAVRKLILPDVLLDAPLRHGGYSEASAVGDEYYVVYAEGRKFGDKQSRGHRIKTGTTLRERSVIIEAVLSLLNGWLEASAPLVKDMQISFSTLALRDYGHMVSERKDNAAEHASWRNALRTSLTNSNYSKLHLVVLYRSPEFRHWADLQIKEALMGAESDGSQLVVVDFKALQPMLYAPLDSGELDPKVQFLPADQKPVGFSANWKKQMRESYGVKRDQWCHFLSNDIGWQPNARRLLLIDSTGEPNIPSDQQIKGAVRDACNREDISSQFIVGNLKTQGNDETDEKLKGESLGRLKNAALDLILRQQGILYAPPQEIYESVAGLDHALSKQLDVIGFCRLQRNDDPKLSYALAVRLRAEGEVDVMLPGSSRWIPYDMASHEVGKLFSDARITLGSASASSPLRLDSRGMREFVRNVLTTQLERPTIAVIEAEGWRNGRGQDRQKHGWTQLRNNDLFKSQDSLVFGEHQYSRSAPALANLLAVVRIRMDDETPHYITAGDWASEEIMRDIPYLTGYIDPVVQQPFHYFSIAGLPEMQKDQDGKRVREAFKADIKDKPQDDMAIKHSQMIELVPFYVHPDFQTDEGLSQICRCVHFLRISPAFTMGDILVSYPMHLGEKLLDDQLVIVGADD